MSKNKQEKKFNAFINLNKKIDDQGKFYIYGYASTDDKDRQNQIVSKEALEKASQDLVENSTMFLNHDYDRAIGKVTKSFYKDGKLLIEGFLSDTEQEVITKIEEGIYNAFSIGGKIKEFKIEKTEDSEEEVGVITDLEILEVSVVGIPANKEAKLLNYYFKKALSNDFKKTIDEDDLTEKVVKEEKLIKEKKEEPIKEQIIEKKENKIEEQIVEEKVEPVKEVIEKKVEELPKEEIKEINQESKEPIVEEKEDNFYSLNFDFSQEDLPTPKNSTFTFVKDEEEKEQALKKVEEKEDENKDNLIKELVKEEIINKEDSEKLVKKSVIENSFEKDKADFFEKIKSKSIIEIMNDEELYESLPEDIKKELKKKYWELKTSSI